MIIKNRFFKSKVNYYVQMIAISNPKLFQTIKDVVVYNKYN